jgi:succinate-semialdehyde dehydrogenase/glutarate-semialdehyde dehydrogenase
MSAGTSSFRSTDPSSGEFIEEFALHDDKEIDAALDSAMLASAQMQRAPLALRSDFLRAVSHGLQAQRMMLADCAVEEMGKVGAQALAEVDKCALTLDLLAMRGPEWLSERSLEAAPWQGVLRYDGLGPILAIMPWNFPYWQVIRVSAGLWMAGNPVVLKHAPNVSGCANWIEHIVHEAAQSVGLDGMLVNLRCEVDTTLRLIADKRVRGVTFTGSTEAGRAIGATAGAALKKSVLELGGSDAYIILEDADLELAVEQCVLSRLIANGQSCVAAKRFIVNERVASRFEEAVASRMSNVMMGDPAEPDSELGPLARDDLRAKLEQQVSQSVAHGAEILTGATASPKPGYWYAPTVLRGVKEGMAVFDQETFGPVAAIVRAKDDVEAVRLANASPFGLGAAIFGRNSQRMASIAASLEVGSVVLNDFVRSDARWPFGGCKASGYGRELGEQGVREFTNPKAILRADT